MTYPNAFQSAGTGLSHSLTRMTYPSVLERPIPALLEALEYVDPIPALSKALGQASFHKGTERPVPALLKALGQVFFIPLLE